MHTLARTTSWLVVLLLALVAAGCGDDAKTKTETVEKTVTETVTTSDDGDSDEPDASSTQVEVYLLRGEYVGVAHRSVSGVEVAHRAVEELLAGPTAAEVRAGLGSAIPAGTEVHEVDIADGVATVDLSKRFESGGGSASMSLRVAQVVLTLTQFPTVDSVAFQLDGRDVTAIGGEGVVVDPPLDRADVEDALPAILVEDPAPGDRLDSTVELSGTANVFEAVLEVELRARGRLLDHAPVTASAGTGTRGTWSASLESDAQGAATIVVFSRSPKDGAAINRVAIPIVLG
jgi:hypothetical protein